MNNCGHENKKKLDHGTLIAQEGMQLTPPFIVELANGYTHL
jgi:hypothetical protein